MQTKTFPIETTRDSLRLYWSLVRDGAPQSDLPGLKTDRWLIEWHELATDEWYNRYQSFILLTLDKPRKRVVDQASYSALMAFVASELVKEHFTRKDINLSGWDLTATCHAYLHARRVLKARDPRYGLSV